MLASTFYLILGGVGGVLALATLGGGFFAVKTKDSRARKRLFNRYAPERNRSIPREVNAELDGLRLDLQRLLEFREDALAEKVGEVITLCQELFAKLHARNEHQANLAAVNYADLLAKLNQALSDDYYFNMLEKPQLWSRVEERKRLVHSVATAIAAELLQNIRDFNSHADIHHDVNLESVLDRANARAILDDLA